MLLLPESVNLWVLDIRSRAMVHVVLSMSMLMLVSEYLQHPNSLSGPPPLRIDPYYDNWTGPVALASIAKVRQILGTAQYSTCAQELLPLPMLRLLRREAEHGNDHRSLK